MKRLLPIVVLAGLLNCVNGFGITARELLASPWQRQRDMAARVMQNTYKPIPRTKWDALMNSLKPGTKASVAQELLRSVDAVPMEVTNSAFSYNFRLDDLWVLRCSFTNSPSGKSEPALQEARLDEDLKDVWVEVPSDFTGVWTTYWANGQPSHRIEAVNGRFEGAVTTFFPSGAKNVVAFYHNGVREGEVTEYYESGAIKSKGEFSAGRQVGKWVSFFEDGAVESETNRGVR